MYVCVVVCMYVCMYVCVCGGRYERVCACMVVVEVGWGGVEMKVMGAVVKRCVCD